MSRACVASLFALAIALVAWPSSARAQQDLMDNLMLLGRSETLRLPGVERVEEHPAAKNPPSLHARMLEDAGFHRPLESRLHPMESFSLEPKPSLLEEEAERAIRSADRPLPRLPEPAGDAASAPAIPGIDDPGPADGLTLEAAIERLVRSNRTLVTLYHEIPQAQADTVTAGLLGNPLIFSGANRVPYGRWTGQPGAREYPIIISCLLDLSGRR